MRKTLSRQFSVDPKTNKQFRLTAGEAKPCCDWPREKKPGCMGRAHISIEKLFDQYLATTGAGENRSKW